MTTIATLLARLNFEPDVAEFVVQRYAASHPGAVAANRSLDDFAHVLVRLAPKLDVRSAEALAASTNPKCLDAVLATRENRDHVLNSLRTCWELSAADQLRFVRRSLSPRLAESVVADARFTTEARLIALLRTRAEFVRDTLFSLATTPDEARTTLCAVGRLKLCYDPKHRYRDVDFVFLAASLCAKFPTLSTELAEDEDWRLRYAAAWWDQEPTTAKHLVAEIIENASSRPEVSASTLMALLRQPTLEPALAAQCHESLEYLASLSDEHDHHAAHYLSTTPPLGLRTSWERHCAPTQSQLESFLIQTGPFALSDEQALAKLIALTAVSRYVAAYPETQKRHQTFVEIFAQSNFANVAPLYGIINQLNNTVEPPLEVPSRSKSAPRNFRSATLGSISNKAFDVETLTIDSLRNPRTNASSAVFWESITKFVRLTLDDPTPTRKMHRYETFFILAEANPTALLSEILHSATLV